MPLSVSDVYLIGLHLRTLEIGDQVRYRKGVKWIPAIIYKHTRFPRLYLIKTEEGKILRRNRSQLKADSSAEITVSERTSTGPASPSIALRRSTRIRKPVQRYGHQ